MSANDKLAATFGPGRTTPTPTLEARIASAVGRVVTNCSNWPTAVQHHLLGRDLSEPIDKIVAALAPVIASSNAAAWHAGRESVALDMLKPAGDDLQRPVTPNPYRSNDE